VKAAIRVETIKLVRSPVGMIGSLALILGTLALLAGITAALAAGDPALTAKAGIAAALDWGGLLTAAAQIASAGGLLGFGVVLSWIFAREFSDGTITGLFALPITRARIALAKLTVYAAWSVAISVALALGTLVLGLTLGYGWPSPDVWAAFGRQVVLGVLTAVVATPVAWIASIARSLLAAVGGAIALVVIAQVGVLAGAGGWMPLAAPALWAISNGTGADPVQLSLTLALGVILGVLTCTSWARLQLNR